MIPPDHRDTGNRPDPYTEPNSFFNDSSDSLNSMKVPLHLEKTPLFFFLCSDKIINSDFLVKVSHRSKKKARNYGDPCKQRTTPSQGEIKSNLVEKKKAMNRLLFVNLAQ